MQHSVVSPNIGQSIVHHFGEGASVWGDAITPSVAHLIHTNRELAIDFSAIRPGIVFERIGGAALLPHVVDSSKFRMHTDATVWGRAVGASGTVDASLHCLAGTDCGLRLWGRAEAESPAAPTSHQRTFCRTVPIMFTVRFWEISRVSDSDVWNLTARCHQKDLKISELEGKVALSMCSQ